MKYIKNLEDQTQSVLAEDVAKDAAEVSGLDADAVSDAVAGLNFASYLELGNAITNQDGELIRELLNISDVVPDEPIADDEIDLEENTIAQHDAWANEDVEAKAIELVNTAVERSGDLADADDVIHIIKTGWTSLNPHVVNRAIQIIRNESPIEEEKLLDKPTPSLKDLAKKHDKSLSAMGIQLVKGIKAEKEHTTDMLIAKEIALDHLNELPDYYDRLEKMEEADNPSAPAVASPAQQAVTPPSAGSSIDALAQPADTATEVDDQEVQQGRKEVDDLQIGDEIEVADIDGQPAAGRVRNLAGPGDTLVITGKGEEEHMIRKDSILSTPLIPVQEPVREKRQARLDKTNLGKKNKRAERVEDKKKKDVYEVDTDAMREAYETALGDKGTIGASEYSDMYSTEETHADMVEYWKQSLSQSIVRKGVFTQMYDAANKDIDELNAAIADQAESIADSYHGSGEGIGSSDQNHFIYNIAQQLGIDDVFGWDKPKVEEDMLDIDDNPFGNEYGLSDAALELKDIKADYDNDPQNDEIGAIGARMRKLSGIASDEDMERLKTGRYAKYNKAIRGREGLGEDWMEDAAAEDVITAEFNEKEWAPLGFKFNKNWPGGTTFVANGDPRKLVRAKFKQEGWKKQDKMWWKHPTLDYMSALEFDRGRVSITSMLVPSYMKNESLEEGIGFHFYVEPQEVGALVVSSKGEIHDFYEDETEARRVAEQLNAQYGKVDEGKYNYPQGMKGKGAAYKEPGGKGQKGSGNRKARKAFRKKQRAEAHAARMRGEVDEDFEHYGSGADFIPVKVNGREIGVVWQEGEGDWHAEYGKTGSSWGMIDSYEEAVELIKDEAGVLEDISRIRELAGIEEAVDEFDTDTGDMFADTHPKRKIVEIVREILEKHKIDWRGGSWEGSQNVRGYIGRDGRRHLDYPEFEVAATPKQVKRVTDEIRQNLPQAEVNMDEWGLSVITETASSGGTGAGAIAGSPVAIGGVQKRNPSIYGQTRLKKKPTPKKRQTKEGTSAGIGRSKKA